jgi:hypothetical protein
LGVHWVIASALVGVLILGAGVYYVLTFFR